MAGFRERIERSLGVEGLLGGETASAWSGSVADLLYDGEAVETTVDVGENSVVVTSHRVLALTPDSDGENFRAVDRPNVDGVRAGHDGDDELLGRGFRVGVYAAILLAIGSVVDFGSLIPSGISAEGAGAAGVGGLFSTMNRFLGLFAQLDDLMLTFGALALFLAAVMLGVWLLTRDRVLVVAVAGGEDVHVPAEDDAAGAVERLDAALFGGGAAGVGTGDPTDADGFKSDDPL